MRHICVIGDSSTAAIKAGWAEIEASYEDITLTFFAAPGESLRSLERSGRCLTTSDDAVAASLAMTSGGLSTIDLDDYDEVWIAGLGVMVASSVQVYSGFRSEEHADLGDEHVLVSQQAFDLMVKGGIRNSAAARLVSLIGDTVDTVPVICRPLPCEDIVAVEPPWTAANGDDASAIVDSFVRGVEEVSDGKMRVHVQPPSVCASPLTTKREYSMGGVALDMSTAPDVEMWHMNAKFGVEILRQMFSETTASTSKDERGPAPCGCSSLCSPAMLERPGSLFADYLKETRRRYDRLRRAKVVMTNVTCPRAVEMVQYVTAAKEMLVLWHEPDHGEARLPPWCQIREWTPEEGGRHRYTGEVASMIGDRPADIVVDCKARSETFAACSHLVEKSGRGYLAMTESSPASAWSRLSAELCLDLATYQSGRRDVIMDDRHIWARWTQGQPRADVPRLGELRSDIIDTFAGEGSGR